MNHLGLPHPKLMEIAVPANLRCGQTDGHAQLPDEPSWAALVWTFAGLWEIEPQALEDAGPEVQIVDVRESAEFAGSLGHILGARLMPLAELQSRLDELDHARPVVTVCRSGTRSAQAAVLLGKAGLAQVANLAGGMLRWRAAGHAVVGGVA
jgi:sulfur dioxygenase